MIRLPFPEIIIIVVLAIFWLIPIAAGIWTLITLQRIRSGQEVIRLRLEVMERMLQRSASN
jgi:hypothetical protein